MGRNHYAVLMSGGLDSTALAHSLLASGVTIHPYFCTYKQKMLSHETIAVHAVLSKLRISYPNKIENLVVVNMGSIGPSRLVAQEDGGISKEETLPYLGVHEAYVPCRDALMVLHVASLIEAKYHIRNIALGVHRTDELNNFPDCNNLTWNVVEDLLRVSMSRGDIRIATPLITWTKADVVEYVKTRCPELMDSVFSGYGNALES